VIVLSNFLWHYTAYNVLRCQQEITHSFSNHFQCSVTSKVEERKNTTSPCPLLSIMTTGPRKTLQIFS